MSAVDALFWVACLVLVVAGAAKLGDPSAVAATLSATSRGGLRSARVLGATEVVVGIMALAFGGVYAAAAVAVAYVAFAVVVVLARRRGLQSCGCFGARSAPPSPVHVAVNLVSACVAVAAVASTSGAGPIAVTDGLVDLGAVAGTVAAALVVLAATMTIVVDTLVADVVEATGVLRDQSTADDGGPVGLEGM